MTFADAVNHVNEIGWSIHHLGQTWLDDGFPNNLWECTLRRLTGPARREICRGKAPSPEWAVMDALTRAPEDEPEVNVVISDNIALAVGDGIPDLLALIGRPLGPQVTRR